MHVTRDLIGLLNLARDLIGLLCVNTGAHVTDCIRKPKSVWLGTLGERLDGKYWIQVRMIDLGSHLIHLPQVQCRV